MTVMAEDDTPIPIDAQALGYVMSGSLPVDEHALALRYARAHLNTHVLWRRHLRRGGELPAEEVGDLEHHQKAIAELKLIIRVLERQERE